MREGGVRDFRAWMIFGAFLGIPFLICFEVLVQDSMAVLNVLGFYFCMGHKQRMASWRLPSLETLKMTVDYTGHMQKQARHASPLGRAHTEPVNPGEVGCDRPERPSGSERAGFVT